MSRPMSCHTTPGRLPWPLALRPEAYSCLSAFPTWTGTEGPVGSWELRKQAAGSENQQQRNEQEAQRPEVLCAHLGAQRYSSPGSPRKPKCLFCTQR